MTEYSSDRFLGELFLVVAGNSPLEDHNTVPNGHSDVVQGRITGSPQFLCQTLGEAGTLDPPCQVLRRTRFGIVLPFDVRTRVKQHSGQSFQRHARCCDGQGHC